MSWDLDLTNTEKALGEYDHLAPKRDRQGWAATTDEDVRVWQQAEKEAWGKVCLAFFEDSKDRNSLEDCLLLDPNTIRGWIIKWKTSQQQGVR